tara:strand:+ start:44 stop:634 length:591 start_codon:yes stop_codon:yes gene_type:complete
MINLLSYEKQAEIRAGRQNSTLLKLLIISLASLGLIVLLLAGSYAVLVTTRDQATKRAEANQTKINNYSKQKAEIDSYKKDLDMSKEILSKEVNYTSIFLAIGAALPNDAIVEQLDVKPENFDNGLTMVVYSRTREAMVSVKNNMQAVPDIFKDVRFSSVDFSKCKDRPGLPIEQTPYSCEATLDVVFNEKVKGIQ